MFEKIVLRRSDKGPALSAGELAEALLYYQNVHLILDQSSLGSLISQIGMPTILALLSRSNISAIYCESSLATHTTTQNGVQNHSFIAYKMAGDKDSGQLKRRNELLEWMLVKKHGYAKKQARRYIERFRRKVPFRDVSSDYFIEGGVIEAARLDLSDQAYVQTAVTLALEDYIGQENVPEQYRFDVLSSDDGFQIRTDLDFEEVSRISNFRNPEAGDRNKAHFAGTILDARADIVLASHYGGEFYTSNLTSRIICTKYSELLHRLGIEKNEIREFEEIVIDSGPSIREVINSGERTFDDFLKVLDRAEKFKEFLQGVNPDEKLVKEYWAQVTSEGWVNSLPVKIVRYVLGSAIGAIEPVTGHAYSATDSFLIERILAGWRPNHFVQGQLNKFTAQSDK